MNESRERQRSLVLAGAAALLILATVAAGSTDMASGGFAPHRVNFQGVLRDASGTPSNGSFDMVFRFFDAETGGNEVMVEAHEAAGTGSVTVVDGLFNVLLGTGARTDGAAVLPGDPYLEMWSVFQDFTNMWLEVEVTSGSGPEVLAPRVRFASVPYAFNSRQLDGFDSSQILNNSAADQSKLGDLSLGGVHILGNRISFASGAEAFSVDGGLSLTAGDSDTDAIVLVAGNEGTDGTLEIDPLQGITLRSKPGFYSFLQGSSQVPALLIDSAGNTDLIGDLRLFGGGLSLGPFGPFLTATENSTSLTGTTNSNDLFLTAGDTADDGSISIFGDGDFDLQSGNGSFRFLNGSTAIETALLDGVGNLQIDGDLTVSGGDLTAASNLVLSSGTGSNSAVSIQAKGSAVTYFDYDGSSTAFVSWCVGNTCAAPGTQMQLEEDGDLRVGGVVSQNQFDLAESYLMGEPLEPGDVVRLHPGIKGAVLLSRGADDATVLGVVSERPGVVLGGAPFGAETLERMWGTGIKERYLQQREILMAQARARDARPQQDHVTSEGTAPATATESAEQAAIAESAALESFYKEHFVPVALAGRVPVKVDGRYGAIEPGDPLSPSPAPGVAMRSDGSGPTIGLALERFEGGRGKVEAYISREQAPSGLGRQAERRLEERVDSRTLDPVTGIQRVAGHVQVLLDRDEDDEARFSIFRDGKESSLGAEVFRVDEQGNVFSRGALRPASMDLAEFFPLSARAEAGDVLVADPHAPGRYRPATEAEDQAVVGVVAGEPGIVLGSGFDRMAAVAPSLAAAVEEARNVGDREEEARAWRALEAAFLKTYAAVSLSGTTLVKVDAGYGSIRVGDLLTTSATAGHAMRADDPRPGTVIGKALESLEGGTGTVRMLVMLR